MKQNKTVVLTGATGGIGMEIAKKLAKEGYDLFLTSETYKELCKLRLKLWKINHKINIGIWECNFNANDLIEIQNLLDSIENTFPKIDVLINCAGVFKKDDIENLSWNDFDQMFNVNIKAPFILAKELIPNMKENKSGIIINIGSSSSYKGFAGNSVYCASKHALLGLTRALREELDPYIRVYCVSPGGVKTKMGRIAARDNPKLYNTFLDPRKVADSVIKLLYCNSKDYQSEVLIIKKDSKNTKN